MDYDEMLDWLTSQGYGCVGARGLLLMADRYGTYVDGNLVIASLGNRHYRVVE